MSDARDAFAALSPACRAAARPALFGGSFDPVHRGHLHCARAARAAFELDHVVLVPAARPPHKPGRALASGEHRLAMLAIALAHEPDASLWDVELRRAGPSYTIDTLRALARERGSERGLHLILGGDNLPGLPEWRAVEELLALAQPIVIHRAESFERELERLAGRLSAAALERLERGLCRVEPVPVSASQLRAQLARGEDPGRDLDAGVWEYATRLGIYCGA